MDPQTSNEDRRPPAQDPLATFGPSLFLSILHHLPVHDLHRAELVCTSWQFVIRGARVSIYDRLCTRAGVKPGSSPRTFETVAAQAASDHPSTDGATEDTVDWHRLLKDHYTTQNAWRHGRLRDRWICTDEVPVWRYKVDNEQGTVICSSRQQPGGLSVVDLATGQPLFRMPGVRAYAHLELAAGHLIFDSGAMDLTLEVFRTQAAANRSSRPSPSPSLRPEVARTVSSLSDPAFDPAEDWAGTGRTIPRGHLAWYRTITPPTQCLAFRARVDHEGVPGQERAVLGTAGEEAVYLWDLDDPGRFETIPIKPQNRCRIHYIEFDEHYVFLCGPEQLHVYSRQTRLRLLSWPPDNVKVSDVIACAFNFDLQNESQTVSAQQAEENSPHHEAAQGDAPTHEETRIAWTERLEDEGRWRGDPDIMRVLRGAQSEDWDPVDEEMRTPGHFDHSACHFTTTDLVCTTRMGIMWIMRDYREMLQQPTEEMRLHEAARRIIWLGMKSPTELLSTHGDRIMVVTEQNIVLINSTSLPKLPRPQSYLGDHPRLALHLLISTTSQGVTTSSCAQMDDKRMYLNYWAKGEADAGGAPYPRQGRLVPPADTQRRLGVVVRAWEVCT